MEKIEHSTISTNGINMHIASIGTGPAVLFLHGFPELWYSWRHQMISLSSLGYRCIAPDLRGYGDTDAPKSPASYSSLHIIGDVVGLLDHLGIDQVFLVGHDWGAYMAWYFCLFRPERVKALVNLGIVYISRKLDVKFLDEGFRASIGDDFYICRFQVKTNMYKYNPSSFGIYLFFFKYLLGQKSIIPVVNLFNASVPTLHVFMSFLDFQ